MDVDPFRLAAMLTVLGLVGAFLRWVWPKWRAFYQKVDAGLTAVIGHNGIRDPANPKRMIEPPRPGLGSWMESTDAALGVLSTAVTALAQQHAQLDDHERRIGRLEDGVVERLAARADSTAAFEAIGRVAASSPTDDDNSQGENP